jgi:hypothetical protein
VPTCDGCGSVRPVALAETPNETTDQTEVTRWPTKSWKRTNQLFSVRFSLYEGICAGVTLSAEILQIVSTVTRQRPRCGWCRGSAFAHRVDVTYVRPEAKLGCPGTSSSAGQCYTMKKYYGGIGIVRKSPARTKPRLHKVGGSLLPSNIKSFLDLHEDGTDWG